MKMSTFPRSKWKLMAIQDHLLRFLSVCILTWLLYIIKNKERVIFVWELECLLHQDPVGHRACYSGNPVSRRPVPKSKDLGEDAEW